VLTVSNYHYIRENFETKFPSIFGVTPIFFRQQLLLLKKTGIFIHPNDLINNFDEILKSEQNHILITFDDGLKEQYDIALPILTELNIPAIFFINTINHIEKKVSLVHKIHLVRSVVSTVVLYEKLVHFAGKNLSTKEVKKAHVFYRFDDNVSAELKYFLNVLLDSTAQEKFINSIFTKNFDEKEVLEKLYMGAVEIQQLIKRGYIGSHTHTHLPLGICEEQTIIYELETTKKYLENLGGVAIDCVAYPYGTKEAATEEVGRLAKQVGYKIGFTTKPGLNNGADNPLLLNRYDCNDLIGGKNYNIDL
jgi:peptidoglycan/xylan/chitin deacetylase (PgdA/CDA1 family)